MQRTQRGIAGRLARTNPTTVFLVTLVLVLVAFFTPGMVGGLLTLLLASALAALLVTTWSVQTPQTRAIRLLALTLLVTAGLVKLL
jgi:predicted membrane metal-binding protein